MRKAKVTFKGQVTIPKAVRERMRPSARQLRGILSASRPYPGHEVIKEEAERAAVEEAMPHRSSSTLTAAT